MPKPVLTEARFDFRGGRNTSSNPDNLNPTELTDSTNARLDVLGAIVKRTGSRRMHATAIGSGAAVKGVTQWQSPSGNQIVAIANGRLYHKLTDFGEFTEVIPGAGDEFSTTAFAHFATFRAASAGAPLRLFIASGGKYYKWDGTTLARIDGVNSAPTAILLKPYHTRMFAVDSDLKKHAFWSKVGDAENFISGLATDGGQALIDVLTGDAIVTLETVGSSLLFFTNDAIVRFTGYSSDDIQIAQDTAGVSSEVGAMGELAAIRVEGVAAFMSDRGAYIASEAGTTSIGVDVEPDFDAFDRTRLANVVVGHHRQRREVWFVLDNKALVYNYRVQNWCGPFTYPFNITYLTRFEDSTESEWIMAGCDDGFVRHLDTGAKDDVLAGGTGGSLYTMTVELAPFFFASGPGLVKTLRRINVQADLPAPTALDVQHSFDRATYTSNGTITGLGVGARSYRVDIGTNNQGKRLRLRFQDASADIPILNGVLLEAFDQRRA